jgi:hypothetical protein
MKMQYIILIGDENLNLYAIKTVEHYGSIGSYDVKDLKNRFCVDYGKDHIFYDYEGSSIIDYEKSDLKKINKQKPHFMTMVYTSEERMKSVIQQDNFLRGIYVDNDYGLILPIEEFIRLGMPMDTRK